jgi:hypothetical protein
MLIKLTNKHGNTFLLESNYIYEIGPTKNEDGANSIVFSTMADDNRKRVTYTIKETVDEVYAQIEIREKLSK